MIKERAVSELAPTDRLGPYLEVSDEELAPYRPFTTPELPELPFERSEGIARARDAWVEEDEDGHAYFANSWGSKFWMEEGAASVSEARFWIALCTTTSFLEEGERDLSFIDDVGEPPDDLTASEVVKRVLGDPDEHDLEAMSNYYPFVAKLLRPLYGYHEILGAMLDQVHPDAMHLWVNYLGPPTPEHAPQALEQLNLWFDSLGRGWRVKEFERLLTVLPHDDWIARHVEEAVANGRFWMKTSKLLHGVQDDALFLQLCELARKARAHPWQDDVMDWFARFGADDVEGLFNLVLRRDPAQYWEPVYGQAFRARSPDWVRVLQPLATRRKAAPIVDAYLRNEGINAVEGLLRLVDSRGKKRLWALDWLEELSREPSRRAMIDERLPHHPKVADTVRERLSDTGPEPLDDVDLPTWAAALTELDAVPPGWLDIDRLEPAVLAEGAALPSAVVAGLLHVGASPPPTGAIVNAGDVASSMLDQWGFDTERSDDAMRVFGWLAGDHEAAKLGELLRSRDAWPAQWRTEGADAGNRQRAISTLARIEGAAARRELFNLVELHAEVLRNHVRGELKRLRDEHGWTEADYADLSVPTLGLDAQGERSFDYGSRAVRLAVRGKHDLVFIDESTGKEYTRLPPRKKADDPELVRRVKEQWELLKRPLVEVFDEQCERFVRAMVHQRAWSAPQWRTRIIEHHLVGHVARRLVWCGTAGGAGTAFRWSPEGDAHDVDFDTVDVDGFDLITVAHPAMVDAATWTEIFADLEVVQPFDQLGRPVLRELTVEPGAKLHGRRLADAMVEGDWDLSGAKWYRAPVLTLADPTGYAAIVELRYGVEVSGTGRVKPKQMDQDLVDVRAERAGEPIALDQLPSALASELFSVLDRTRLD